MPVASYATLQIRRLCPGFCSLTTLHTLSVEANAVITFPPNFGNLRSLQVLRVGANVIEEFPPSFSALQVRVASRRLLSPAAFARSRVVSCADSCVTRRSCVCCRHSATACPRATACQWKCCRCSASSFSPTTTSGETPCSRPSSHRPPLPPPPPPAGESPPSGTS